MIFNDDSVDKDGIDCGTLAFLRAAIRRNRLIVLTIQKSARARTNK